MKHYRHQFLYCLFTVALQVWLTNLISKITFVGPFAAFIPLTGIGMLIILLILIQYIEHNNKLKQ